MLDAPGPEAASRPYCISFLWTTPLLQTGAVDTGWGRTRPCWPRAKRWSCARRVDGPAFACSTGSPPRLGRLRGWPRGRSGACRLARVALAAVQPSVAEVVVAPAGVAVSDARVN